VSPQFDGVAMQYGMTSYAIFFASSPEKFHIVTTSTHMTAKKDKQHPTATHLLQF